MSRPSCRRASASPTQPSDRPGRDLHQTLELLARVFVLPAREEPPGEVRARGREPRIDLERRSVVLLGLFAPALVVCEHAKGVMRGRKILVEVASPEKIAARLLEVAAPELDIPEVDPGLHEARVVLERDREPRLGHREIALADGAGPGRIELEGFGGKWSGGRTGQAGEGQRREKEESEQGESCVHVRPIGKNRQALRTKSLAAHAGHCHCRVRPRYLRGRAS